MPPDGRPSAATRAGLHTWAVDYRMPPDHPYPTPLDDCVAVYRALLEQQPAEKIVVGGGSAGGNLAAALMLRAARRGPADAAGAACSSRPRWTSPSRATPSTPTRASTTCSSSRLTESIALYAERPRPHRPVPVAVVRRRQPAFPPTFLQAGHPRPVPLQHRAHAPQAARRRRRGRAPRVGGDAPRRVLRRRPEDAEIGVEARAFIAKHL